MKPLEVQHVVTKCFPDLAGRAAAGSSSALRAFMQERVEPLVGRRSGTLVSTNDDARHRHVVVIPSTTLQKPTPSGATVGHCQTDRRTLLACIDT